MKRHIVLGLGLLLNAPLLFSADAQPKAPEIPVMVVQVVGDSEIVTQDLPGRVSAYRTAQVRARVTGIIENRVFEEGSNVEAGQVLFQIESRSLKATVRARKADVANAVAAYNLSRQTLKRYKKLLSLGAVSRQEYDSNRAQNQQSRAQVEQARANLEIADINLKYATVSAPISGRIDKALVTEGALTTADSTQLATIEQIDKVYIDFTRSSADVIRIRQATSAGRLTNTKNKNIEILFSDGSAYEKKGHLEFSSMTVDQATGAISLRAVVDNPKNSLLPGMFVRVKVPVATTNNTIKIPQKAVNITGQGAKVFIVKDKKLIALNVQLGPMKGDSWFVKAGLNIGDKVVLSDTSIIKTIPGATFIGMTAQQMKAAGISEKKKQ
jgi:membrane fusion protein (multidrug efflux system)